MTERSADETLARSYCEAIGLDPDAITPISCPDGQAGCCVMHYGLQWQAALPRARQLLTEMTWAQKWLSSVG